MTPRYDTPDPDDPDEQPSLFDHGLAPRIVPVPGTGSIEGNFLAFHAANPWVYTALVRLARDLHNSGRRKVGIGMLFEVLRWQWTRATTDQASDFKLNNNYRSRYARLIMRQEPDLDGVFDTRILHAA